MSTDDHIVSAEALKSFTKEIFRASDVAEDHAETWADILIWANMRGMDSHGVLRVPRYIAYMKNGNIHAQPDIKVEKRAGAIAILDSDWAPGPVAMSMAMDEAIGRARECHVGWCIVRNITHGGAIGYYALQAARAGFAGIDLPDGSFAKSIIDDCLHNMFSFVSVCGAGKRFRLSISRKIL